jgi:hypothetical protein
MAHVVLGTKSGDEKGTLLVPPRGLLHARAAQLDARDAERVLAQQRAGIEATSQRREAVRLEVKELGLPPAHKALDVADKLPVSRLAIRNSFQKILCD